MSIGGMLLAAALGAFVAAPCAVAAPAAPIRPAGMLPSSGFRDVSMAWGISLRHFFESPGAQPEGLPALFTELRKLNLENKAHRALLAPVVEALVAVGYTPGLFAGEKNEETRRILMGAAISAAHTSVSEKVRDAIRAAQDDRAEPKHLAAAEEIFEQVENGLALYLSEEDVAAAAAATPALRQRIADIRAAGVTVAVERTAEELGALLRGPAVVAPDNPSTPAAEEHLAGLREAQDGAGWRLHTEKLLAIASRAPNERLQLLIARGFLAAIGGNNDLQIRVVFVEGLEALALKSAFPSVQRVAVQGILNDTSLADDKLHVERALTAVERIALRSESDNVKRHAMELLKREIGTHEREIGTHELEIGEGADPEVRRVEAMIDRIGESQNGLEERPAPRAPRAPKTPAPDAPPEESVASLLWSMVKDHPFLVTLLLIAAANTIAFMAADAYKPIGITVAALLAGIVMLLERRF